MPLPCSVLWSDNHMIIKACSRNILLQANYSIILTNNNLWLLFSRDRSYEGIIFDKSFICNFVLHFYESHTNVSISIQSFTCHHTVIWATKINLKVPGGLSCQGLPLFLKQEKLAKCSYFSRCCSTHFPLIFGTHSLIILLLIKFAFFGQSLWILGIT